MCSNCGRCFHHDRHQESRKLARWSKLSVVTAPKRRRARTARLFSKGKIFICAQGGEIICQDCQLEISQIFVKVAEVS